MVIAACLCSRRWEVALLDAERQERLLSWLGSCWRFQCRARTRRLRSNEVKIFYFGFVIRVLVRLLRLECRVAEIFRLSGSDWYQCDVT